MNLTGEWKVGLSEIIFPKTWYNIPRKAASFVLSHNGDLRIGDTTLPPEWRTYTLNASLSAGQYDTIEEVLNMIHETIKKRCKVTIQDENVKKLIEWTWPKFKYHGASGKVHVTLPGKTRISLSEHLSEMIGFDRDQIPLVNETETPIQIKGNRAADISAGLHGMYIYCDLLEHVHVGDVLAQLLRIVDTEGPRGQTLHKYFEKPRYIPLQKKSFDTIEILIKDDFGKIIPFETGKLVVTVHFRRARGSYFLT